MKRFDVVRLLQVRRDAPADEYAETNRTVGSVYRKRGKGRLTAVVDIDRTDPWRLRDIWSSEIFLVSRVVFTLDQVNRHIRIPAKYDPSRRKSNHRIWIDRASLAASEIQILEDRGVLPRYIVRFIDLQSSAGRHVDLVALRMDASRALNVNDLTRVGAFYPHYRLEIEHDLGYLRSDLLRIPQDMLHRFKSSVTSVPPTRRRLSPVVRRIPLLRSSLRVK